MAAPSVASDYDEMFRFIDGNINSLNESAVVLRTRLETWRNGFFPLLDKQNPEEAKIHSWALPTSVMINDLADSLDWNEINELVAVVIHTITALNYNGYTNAAIEAAVVAVFNSAWT